MSDLDHLCDLMRQFPSALADLGPDSDEAKQLDREIWNAAGAVPGIDTLEEERIHYRAYPDPRTRPTRLTR
jgi:hypothetical protein